MRITITAMLVCLISVMGQTQSDPDFVEIASGFEYPTAIRNANDGSGRLFVCERKGVIKVLSSTNSGFVLNRPFLDIQSKVQDGAEKGLQALSFHPKFPQAPYCYVSYITMRSGEYYSRIERYTIIGDPNVAISGSGRTILEIPQSKGRNTGGDIQFGPDGMLYVALGDEVGSAAYQGAAQDFNNLLGSILRIDIDGEDFPYDPSRNYAIPKDNPWIDREDIKSEIWAMGLRDPHNLNFDSETGSLLITDRGQDSWEELNVQLASSQGGENYGWNCMEGHISLPNQDCNDIPLVNPSFVYDHYEGCAIVGGITYRGHIFPEWEGHIFATDLCSRSLWIIDAYDNYEATKHEMTDFGSISSFCAADNGEIYLSTMSAKEGKLYRMINRAVCPGRLLDEVVDQVGDIQLNSLSSSNSNLAIGSQKSYGDPRFLQAAIQIQTEDNKEILMEACIEDLLAQE